MNDEDEDDEEEEALDASVGEGGPRFPSRDGRAGVDSTSMLMLLLLGVCDT